MNDRPSPLEQILGRGTLHPHTERWLAILGRICGFVALAAVVIRHGLRDVQQYPSLALGIVIVASLALASLSWLVRYRWSRTRQTFVRENRTELLLLVLWLAGSIGLLAFDDSAALSGRWLAVVAFSEAIAVGAALISGLRLVHHAAGGHGSPALLLAVSFALLIGIGTALLMLPRARNQADLQGAENSAPFHVAFFTATSASCVTGLIVVPTNPYWSRWGQSVILGLFQVGGLGIMTFGAVYGLISRHSIRLREQSTLTDLLESDGLGQLRRFVLAIFGFTFVFELIGTLVLWSLWPHLPWPERLFFSVFHSVSAFCNAGFSLTENSFVGMETRWQIWGGVTTLIIVGGLGFAVLYNVFAVGYKSVEDTPRQTTLFHEIHDRRLLTIGAKLALITTAALLLLGTVCFFVIEPYSEEDPSFGRHLANAWFQSVTFRTAGFNTIELGDLHPASKLAAIGLMFIGASPGSTGGGIKTLVFAVMILAVVSVLRSRPSLEFSGRRIPELQVKRALCVVFLALAALMTVTFLLVLIEGESRRTLDYAFEAASAVGTVGVSSAFVEPDGSTISVTQSLSQPSQLVIIVAMFIGRVGPLTLLMALAGHDTDVHFEYPEEGVPLG